MENRLILYRKQSCCRKHWNSIWKRNPDKRSHKVLFYAKGEWSRIFPMGMGRRLRLSLFPSNLAKLPALCVHHPWAYQAFRTQSGGKHPFGVVIRFGHPPCHDVFPDLYSPKAIGLWTLPFQIKRLGNLVVSAIRMKPTVSLRWKRPTTTSGSESCR